MKNFRLLIWSAAICGAAVFTGCVDTADNQLSPMEQDWQRAIRSSYPGYRAPKTMPPAVRDSVVYYDAPKAAPAASAAELPAPAAEPAEVVDLAAKNSNADAAPAVQETSPAKAEVKAEEKKAEEKVEAKADEKKAEEKKAEEKTEAKADVKKADSTAEAVVKAGDTIGGIAKEFYGNAKYADVILKANPQVKDPKRLKIGTKLLIPAL